MYIAFIFFSYCNTEFTQFFLEIIVPLEAIVVQTLIRRSQNQRMATLKKFDDLYDSVGNTGLIFVQVFL